MKKRLIYFAVLIAVTLAAVVYGIARRGHLMVSTDGGLSFSFIEKGNTKVSESTDSFGSIDVQMLQADILIEDGKSFGWTYIGPKSNVPSAEVNKDTLVIKSPQTSGNDFSLSGGTLTVTIPTDHWNLKKVSLSTKNGDISIDPDSEAAAQSMELTTANGDISLSDCTGKAVDVSTNNGDIALDDASFDTFDLQSKNGDIALTLADSLDNYTVTPSTSAGDISVGEDTYDSNKNISIGTGKKTVKAVTSLGDIVIDD